MFVLVCPLDASESISLKGWLEDHDFALGKGHGKKTLISRCLMVREFGSKYQILDISLPFCQVEEVQ